MDQLNKFWIVLWHTYTSKVKTKSFITSTAIMLVIILALSNLTTIISYFDDNEADKIGVVDESGQYYDPFLEKMKASQANVHVESIDNQQDGEKLVESGDLEGVQDISNDEQG